MSKFIDASLYNIINNQNNLIVIWDDRVPMPFISRKYVEETTILSFKASEMRKAIQVVDQISNASSEEILETLNLEFNKSKNDVLKEIIHIYSKEKSLKRVYEFIDLCLQNFKAANALFKECVENEDFEYRVDDINRCWMDAIALSWKIQAAEYMITDCKIRDEEIENCVNQKIKVENERRNLLSINESLFSLIISNGGVIDYEGPLPI